MRKMMIYLMVLVMCISMCACSTTPEETPASTMGVPEPVAPTVAETAPVWGSETEDEPDQTVFYIHNAEELFAIDDYSEKTYILENDIDLTGESRTISTFRGLLDGNGKTIYNATAPLIQDNHGTVMNITMQDCNIQSAEDTAAIAVTNEGNISKCVVGGTISSICLSPHAAGIVCHNKTAGIVENCINMADITADSYELNELGNVVHGQSTFAGGIVAVNDGDIRYCMNAGSIQSVESDIHSFAGGIAGYLPGGSIQNCYNAGAIRAEGSLGTMAGGITGETFNATRISCCYNIGTSVSAIADDHKDKTIIVDCYYLTSVSEYGIRTGNPDYERIFAFTEEELRQQSTFSAFDFENIWVMTENGPQLQ